MLDEPSLGIAPLLVARIFEVLKDINRRGTSMLLVEQNAAVALNIAHRSILSPGHFPHTIISILSGRLPPLIRLILSGITVMGAYTSDQISSIPG